MQSITVCVLCITKVTENLSEEILGAAQSVQLSSDSFFSSEGLQGLRELNRLFSNINIQRTTYLRNLFIIIHSYIVRPADTITGPCRI